MRLPHGHIAVALVLMTAWCGPGRNQPPPAGGGNIYPAKDSAGQAKKSDSAMPWVSTEPLPDFDASVNGNRTVFLARVDKEGLIHLGGSIVTEEKYLEEAGKALDVVPGVTAVLLVESGITQGIHLSAQLSAVGYKNVQIYYPTATSHEIEK
jgi:hypothetical protein